MQVRKRGHPNKGIPMVTTIRFVIILAFFGQAFWMISYFSSSGNDNDNDGSGNNILLTTGSGSSATSDLSKLLLSSTSSSSSAGGGVDKFANLPRNIRAMNEFSAFGTTMLDVTQEILLQYEKEKHPEKFEPQASTPILQQQQQQQQQQAAQNAKDMNNGKVVEIHGGKNAANNAVAQAAAAHQRKYPITTHKITTINDVQEEIDNEPFTEDYDHVQGIRSKKEISFFREHQIEIDDFPNDIRCERYGYNYTYNQHKQHRKIYYGAVVEDESWEMLEIIAAEAYGVFEGMVFIESNRTIVGEKRSLRFAGGNEANLHRLKSIFGFNNKNENKASDTTDGNNNEPTKDNYNQLKVNFVPMEKNIGSPKIRADYFRNAILHGWKQLGMTKNDIGYIATIDETFSRDVFRAVQVCDGIVPFDNYHEHLCYPLDSRLIASTRMYKSTPTCSLKHTKKKKPWYHPDMILGHCIDIIGNSTLHPLAPRDGFKRAIGYGQKCSDFQNISFVTENGILKRYYPLWTGGDFRTGCGGQIIKRKPSPDEQEGDDEGGKKQHNKKNSNVSPFEFTYTGYTFRRFDDIDFKSIREEHRMRNDVPIEVINEDFKMLANCVKGKEDDETQFAKRDSRQENLQEPVPIYFRDEEYRKRKHRFVKHLVQQDEQKLK